MADKSPRVEAQDDAKDAVEHFLDEIVDQLTQDGEASTDLTDRRNYSESYHHETHIDRSYSLLDAAKVLDDLGQYEETDSGLWEGQEPRDAISTQAAFTYGNAVYSFFEDEVGSVNDEVGPVAREMMDERAQIEEAIDAFDGLELTPEQENARDAHQARLDQFDENRKKKLTRLVLETIGRKKKARGPKDWNP
jgi:hypothetical protein